LIALALNCGCWMRMLICAEISLLIFYDHIFRKSRGKFKACSKDLGKFHPGKVGAYLINLDRAKDRLNFSAPQIIALGLPLERISAVDGNTLSREYIQSIVDLKIYQQIFKTSPELGTIGCSLSHEMAWRKFLSSDNEFALIFEDDVQFNPRELKAVLKSVLDKKSLWDIVLFEPKHLGCPVKITPLPCGTHLVCYLTNVTHAGCYLICRQAILRLLQQFYPIQLPLDHYFTAAWEFNLKCVGVLPQLVHQNFGASQIKTNRMVKKKVLSPINFIHNSQRAIVHFSYNLFCLIHFFSSATLKKRN
jgi:glycosyl transferase family 25